MVAKPKTSAPQQDGAAQSDSAEFEAILNAAVDGIVISDEQGRILRVNRATEDLLGYAPEELLGQPINIIMNEKDARAHKRYMSNYLRTGKRKIIGIGREVEARRKDGSVFPVSLAIGEAHSATGLRFVGLIRDLTAQKRAEEEALRQRTLMNHASRLTTMGEMAAAMAHEINQPLSAIANYTAAALRLLESDDESAQNDVRTALREIGGQAHRAADIIRRIRDFARSRGSERQPVGVHSMIGEILPLVKMDAKANQVELQVRLDDELPDIVADPIQIQQVLLNLARNGIDSMAELPEEGRRLDLRAWTDEDRQLRIAITDRGKGVSDEAAERLFTPFFTTKRSGMGMGLAISRSIISAHGGTLDYFNNPVSGATFYVVLPVSED